MNLLTVGVRKAVNYTPLDKEATIERNLHLAVYYKPDIKIHTDGIHTNLPIHCKILENIEVIEDNAHTL